MKRKEYKKILIQERDVLGFLETKLNNFKKMDPELNFALQHLWKLNDKRSSAFVVKVPTKQYFLKRWKEIEELNKLMKKDDKNEKITI